MRVKVGPISAEFRGVATIERDEATWSGRIQGSGSDARSNSATRGRILYRLTEMEGGGATRVDLTVGYTLTGVLAQVGRAGIVREVAGRLTAAFAENLEARLGGGGDGLAAPRELRAGSLIIDVLKARVAAVLRRLLGRT